MPRKTSPAVARFGKFTKKFPIIGNFIPRFFQCLEIFTKKFPIIGSFIPPFFQCLENFHGWNSRARQNPVTTRTYYPPVHQPHTPPLRGIRNLMPFFDRRGKPSPHGRLRRRVGLQTRACEFVAWMVSSGHCYGDFHAGRYSQDPHKGTRHYLLLVALILTAPEPLGKDAEPVPG